MGMKMANSEIAKLSLGPVHFNWNPDKWRDFYFRIADEAPIDTVYVGEVVCSKRQPFFEPVIADVIERLQSAGKEVVLSTLALIMSKRETNLVRDLALDGNFLVEANDLSAASLLKGQDHVIGPFINVYNEGTVDFLISQGAKRICLPFELPGQSLFQIAQNSAGRADIEVQVFGRMPLAISARCYHARSYDLTKSNCQFVCADDTDGMPVDTLDGTPFLVVNGTQTLSRSCQYLADELTEMRTAGCTIFRLSPMDTDMVSIAKGFRAVLDGDLETDHLKSDLQNQIPGLNFSNGFYHASAGNSLRQQGECF
jgi:O2-independent ubiquinone biosynthesis protein UbiV